MRAVRVRSRQFNGRQPSGLGKYSIFRLRNGSSSGRGNLCMRGIKIPQYEFALKMQGGLCARGAYLRGTTVFHCILEHIAEFDAL